MASFRSRRGRDDRDRIAVGCGQRGEHAPDRAADGLVVAGRFSLRERRDEAVQDADIGGEIGEAGFNSTVKDGIVILDTAGSSTCPPTIASGTYADGVLKLEREKYESGTPCTMDYRTFRQEISLSDGKKFADDVKVEVAEQVFE